MHFHGINLVFLPHKTRQWHIHFDRLKTSGNLFGQPTTLFPQTFPPHNPSIMFWICSLTHLGLVFTSVTLWAILLVMLLLVSKGIKGLMYCIHKDMIPLDCQPNSTLFKQGNTLPKLQKQISIDIESSSIESGFLLTGLENFEPQTLLIIAGHSGFLCSFLTPGMTPRQTKPNPLMSLLTT